MLGFQLPVIAIAGPAVVYAILIFITFRKRGFNLQQLGPFYAYLLMGAIWALGKGVTVMLGLMPFVAPTGTFLSSTCMLLLPVLLMVLTLQFFEQPGFKATFIIGGVWAAITMLINWNVLGLSNVIQQALNLPTQYDVVRDILLAGWAGFSGVALLLAAWYYLRTQRPLHRNRALYWLFATLSISAGEGMALSPDPLLLQLGSFVRMLGVLLMAYATLNYYLLSVRSLIRRGASSALITLVTAGIFMGCFWLLRAMSQAVPEGMLLVGAAVIAAMLAIIIQPLRQWTAKLVDRLMLGQSYDPAHVLRDYSAAISNILDLDMLVKTALGILSQVFEIQRGTLLLTTETEEGNVLTHVQNGLGQVALDPGSMASTSSILADLRQGRAISQYEIDMLPQYRAAPPEERAWFEKLNMEMYVPIRQHALLAGILALGPKSSGPFSNRDLTVLSTLADHTAVALQNARLVSDLKRLNADIMGLNDELRRTNRRLEKLDEAKDNFIQIASHELRTPLTQMRGYADIMADSLRSGMADPAYMEKISRGISRATVRLEEVISAMLDVSRINVKALNLHKTKLSPTAVVRMAAEGYQEAIKERRITLLQSLEGLPDIEGDWQRLFQAFTNLVGNAIKYTPDGGRVMITGRCLRERDAQANISDYVEIIVADTGIGIDHEDLELIFENFYRVGSTDLHSTGSIKFKGAGPGLGLPIARGIILAHGGKIWASSPGHDETHFPGSEFHVLLPANLDVMPSATPGGNVIP